MTQLHIYLFLIIPGIAENLRIISWAFAIITSLAFFVISILVSSNAFSNEQEKEEAINVNKLLKKVSLVTFICAIIFSLVPSKKELAMIYFVPKIMNNEHVQEFPENILELANTGLKELTEEIKKTVSGEKK